MESHTMCTGSIHSWLPSRAGRFHEPIYLFSVLGFDGWFERECRIEAVPTWKLALEVKNRAAQKIPKRGQDSGADFLPAGCSEGPLQHVVR
jgi:hypothetical protein